MEERGTESYGMRNEKWRVSSSRILCDVEDFRIACLWEGRGLRRPKGILLVHSSTRTTQFGRMDPLHSKMNLVPRVSIVDTTMVLRFVDIFRSTPKIDAPSWENLAIRRDALATRNVQLQVP